MCHYCAFYVDTASVACFVRGMGETSLHTPWVGAGSFNWECSAADLSHASFDFQASAGNWEPSKHSARIGLQNISTHEDWTDFWRAFAAKRQAKDDPVRLQVEHIRPKLWAESVLDNVAVEYSDERSSGILRKLYWSLVQCYSDYWTRD